MNEARDLLQRVRSSRAGRDGRPKPGDPGLIGEDYRLHDKKQDRKFQDAMLLALARRQEQLPPEDKPHAHDSVPRRPFATAHVPTACSLAD